MVLMWNAHAPPPTLLLSAWSPAAAIVLGGCKTLGIWDRCLENTVGTGLQRLQHSMEQLPPHPLLSDLTRCYKQSLAASKSPDGATPLSHGPCHNGGLIWKPWADRNLSFCQTVRFILMEKATSMPFFLTSSKWSQWETEVCRLASVMWFKVIKFFRLPRMHWSPSWCSQAAGCEMKSNVLFCWATWPLCLWL